jgi:hypothetical protein
MPDRGLFDDNIQEFLRNKEALFKDGSVWLVVKYMEGILPDMFQERLISRNYHRF